MVDKIRDWLVARIADVARHIGEAQALERAVP